MSLPDHRIDIRVEATELGDRQNRPLTWERGDNRKLENRATGVGAVSSSVADWD